MLGYTIIRDDRSLARFIFAHIYLFIRDERTTHTTKTKRTLTYRIISNLFGYRQYIGAIYSCIDCELTFRDSGYGEAFAVRVCYVCYALSVVGGVAGDSVPVSVYLCLSMSILRAPKQLPALSDCYFFFLLLLLFLITVVSLIIIFVVVVVVCTAV